MPIDALALIRRERARAKASGGSVNVDAPPSGGGTVSREGDAHPRSPSPSLAVMKEQNALPSERPQIPRKVSRQPDYVDEKPEASPWTTHRFSLLRGAGGSGGRLRNDAAGLKDFRCSGVPGVFYIPDYLAQRDETHILELVYAGQWVQLRNRRLQAIGEQPGAHAHSREVKREIPSWLEQLADTLHSDGALERRPNNVLVNEYQPGQGIFPHQDGPHYYPYVATLSLGAPCVFYFYPYLKPEEVGTRDAGSSDWRALSWTLLSLPPRSWIRT